MFTCALVLSLLFRNRGHHTPSSPTPRANSPAFAVFPCPTINAFGLDQAPEAEKWRRGDKQSAWAEVGTPWLFRGRPEEKRVGKERSPGLYILGEKPNSVLVLPSVSKTSLIRWNHVQPVSLIIMSQGFLPQTHLLKDE